jgi:GTP-binding protein Era
VQAEGKSAFIAIVGKPNVGKSSLMNRILGQKVAIVSNKPQTTRNRIMGVLTRGETQLVFIDTPGLHRPHTRLGEYMVQTVEHSVSGVDAGLLVVEAGAEPGQAELELIGRFASQQLPAVLAINKVDLLQDKTKLMGQIAAFMDAYPFQAVVPISALQGDGVPALIEELCAVAQPGGHFFPEETLTDQPERVMAAELVREKLLNSLEHEVPHGIAVSVERFSERPDAPVLDVSATIYCERESHKGIIIGKKGELLKRVGSAARKEMENFFDCRCNLQLWVKVKENWRNREALLKNFGFDEKNLDL